MEGLLANPSLQAHETWGAESVAAASVEYAKALIAACAEVEETTEKSLTPPDADGWIEHDPKSPIPETVSAVWFKGGMTDIGELAQAWLDDEEDSWDHTYDNSRFHITHYKP